jgi:hypothetical protein
MNIDASAIVDLLAGSQAQLTRLAGAISADQQSAGALFVPLIGGIAGGIAADRQATQAIAGGIAADQQATIAIANGIAADQNLAQAIVDAAPQPQQAAVAGMQLLQQQAQLAPPQAQQQQAAMAQDAPLVEYLGRDANGPVAKEMTITELFHKDPVLFDYTTRRLVDLDNLLQTFDEDTMRRIYMEPGAADVPKIRYAMSRYIETNNVPGPVQTGIKTPSAALAALDPVDRANLSRFPTTLGMTFSWNKEGNPWRTPDNFMDFRRLKLKKGYIVTNRNNAVDTHNDVYVYYFNKVGSTSQNNAVLEIPFDTSNFIIPSGWKAYARYPDGIILYKSPAGVMQAQFPIAPTGTFFKQSTTALPSDYMLAAQQAVTTQKARIDAMNLSRSETQSMYEFAAYLGIMQEVKNEKRIRGGSHATRNRRRHHRNKSVSRKSKMTRRKGRGKGRARAMSMLKSAKQRFYGGDQPMRPPGGEVAGYPILAQP